MKRTAIVAAAFAAALICAKPAAAYVRYTSNSGKNFMWPQTCVQLVAYPADLAPMMPVEEILGAIDAAAVAWSNAGDSCTYLDIIVTSSMDAPGHATNDGHNLVIFRSDTWCKLTDQGECDPDMMYEMAALALTSVSASTASGAIRDADIEVNAVHFKWADLVAHPDLRNSATTYHDLQNALTHEMGHLIGLDHTCYSQGPAPLDSTGAPIPECASASAAILATTMFASANPGDVDKRTLAPDDQLAVCQIYPAAQDPMTCTPPGTPPSEGCSACATARAPARSTGLVVVLAAALLVARARRRRG